MADKRRGLGRGLDKLLGAGANFALRPEDADTTRADSSTSSSDVLRHIPVEQIQPGPYQPRKTLKDEALEELASSIKAQGVMQPIVVRSLPGEKFEIIAGERRWRATQLAGLATVPAIVREVNDEAVVAMALIENIQREALNPIEEAVALQRLISDFSMSHQQVAEAVGKYRPTITNLLRLLSLNDEVKALVLEETISKGHGRVLLALEGSLQNKVAQTIVERQLSVRQTEEYVRQLQKSADRSQPQKEMPPQYQQWQQWLGERFALPVKIKSRTSGKGVVEIAFKSEAELEQLLTCLGD